MFKGGKERRNDQCSIINIQGKNKEKIFNEQCSIINNQGRGK